VTIIRYDIVPNNADPSWSVYEITTVPGRNPTLARRLIEIHYGDHCDANERRYARERAGALARTLARKAGVHANYVHPFLPGPRDL
jgi:hypothetical protein